MPDIKLEVQLDRRYNDTAFEFRIKVPYWLKQFIKNEGAYVYFDTGAYEEWNTKNNFLYVPPENEKPKNDDLED